MKLKLVMMFWCWHCRTSNDSDIMIIIYIHHISKTDRQLSIDKQKQICPPPLHIYAISVRAYMVMHVDTRTTYEVTSINHLTRWCRVHKLCKLHSRHWHKLPTNLATTHYNIYFIRYCHTCTRNKYGSTKLHIHGIYVVGICNRLVWIYLACM